MATEAAVERDAAPAASPRRTIGALWQKAIAEERPFPAYLVEEDGEWREVSWQEAARRVEEIAFGLLALGIKKGDAFGIVSPTRLEWTLVDFALAQIGAVTAPIYPNSSKKDCAYMLELAQAVGVFVDESCRGLVPDLPHVISFDDLDQLEARGRAFREHHPDALNQAEAAIDEEDLFTLIYTSGTTGPPKACMIRHRNYYEMAATVDKVSDFLMRREIVLLWLPLAHNFGRLMHLLGPYAGFTIAFVPDPYRVAEALPHVRPTILPSAPRLFEKMHTAIKTKLDETTGLRGRLARWALRVGYEASPYRQRGEPLPAGLALRHRLADRLVYSKVKARVGGRLRFGLSGAAPLAPDVAEYFHALDILILEGYGLTECTTGCSANRPDRFKFGTVGPPLPEFEIRIAEDGEILIRSQTIFAGYLGDEEATREVLDAEGWLHSGDIGEIDEDGFLRITDRKKDIIVTAGGKNVAPQSLETAVKSANLVSQALVIGDRRPYVVALISLDDDEAAGKSASEIEAAVQEIVDSVNRDRARFEQIKKFAILPRDFSADEGEVTPTMKLKRRVIEENFASEIEALYAQPR